MPARDIVVIGASAGGLEALIKVVRPIPSDLPAAVFVVIHHPPSAPSFLPEILNRHGRLPAAHADDLEAVQPGRIYVARPDHHLLIENDAVRVWRGPRENHTRPAIDPLFRTAAQTYGERVIGVVLSGTLNDGAAGLAAVKRCRGVAVVQDPKDALFNEMPASALGACEVDRVLTAGEIGSALTQIARETVMQPGEEAMSGDELMPTERMMSDMAAQVRGQRDGMPSVFTCPECGGVTWQASEGPTIRFACHTGHAFTGEVLLQEQTEAMEATLWSYLRLLVQNVNLLRQLAGSARRQGSRETATGYEERAASVESRIGMTRNLIEKAGETDLTVAIRRPASISFVSPADPPDPP